MAADTDPARRPRRPIRWRLVLPLLALGGVALAVGVQEFGHEVRNYLAFTTADVAGLLPQAPDPRSAVTRATVRADHVWSLGCGEGVKYCDRPEGEAVKLPRSVTFEFPTELVQGLGKDNRSVALLLPQQRLSDAWVPSQASGREEGVRARGGLTDDAAIVRQIEAEMPYRDVRVALGTYHSASSERRFAEHRLPFPPPCAVTRDSSGLVTVRHAPGYKLRETPAQ